MGEYYYEQIIDPCTAANPEGEEVRWKTDTHMHTTFNPRNSKTMTNRNTYRTGRSQNLTPAMPQKQGADPDPKLHVHARSMANTGKSANKLCISQ